MATIETVRQILLALPGVEERPSYGGTPAFRVRDRFIARLHEDDEHLVLKVGWDERAALVASEPEAFSITPHYENSPMVLVRLATVDPDEFRELLIESWRMSAPRRLAEAYDRGGGERLPEAGHDR